MISLHSVADSEADNMAQLSSLAGVDVTRSDNVIDRGPTDRMMSYRVPEPVLWRWEATIPHLKKDEDYNIGVLYWTRAPRRGEIPFARAESASTRSGAHPYQVSCYLQIQPHVRPIQCVYRQCN